MTDDTTVVPPVVEPQPKAGPPLAGAPEEVVAPEAAPEAPSGVAPTGEPAAV